MKGKASSRIKDLLRPYFHVALMSAALVRRASGVAFMRYLHFLTSLAFLLGASQAQAQTATRLGPSPESDLGLAGFVMVAGAAFLAYRLRRR
jgi:hypothetical protein